MIAKFNQCNLPDTALVIKIVKQYNSSMSFGKLCYSITSEIFFLTLELAPS